ncbi:MAG: hypothetical protein KDC13_00680 [Bacteroidetes bacterium]|nr:hypothetical protein [Bacteroidota bacterium]
MIQKSALRNVFCSLSALFLLVNVAAQDLEQIGQQKPFKLSGGLSVLGNLYQVSGIPPRSKPFLWSINGSPTMTIYGVSLPFYFNIGAQDRSFGQPFNQFGVSPKYKWATAHLGWRSLQFSQFTWGGLVMMGYGAELNPGKFRLAFFRGRLNKTVKEDSTQSFYNVVPSYRRMGTAFKFGVGSANNYVDLSFLKAKDDSSSYPDAPVRLRPQENAVLGITGRFLIKKHVTLGFDGAASGYTRDMSVDSTGDPELERIRFILPANASTQLLFAGNAFIGYVSKAFNIKFNYKRIDQDFKSMGSYIYQSDLEAITIEPSFSLLKNKIRLNGSLGFQHDNLNKNRFATTERTIGSVSLSLQPSPVYGLDIQYSNYGITQRAGIIPINDTTRMALVNRNVSCMNRYMKVNRKTSLMLVGLAMYQNLSSVNEFQAAALGNRVWVGNLSANYAILATGLSFTAGFNYTSTEFAAGESVLAGPTAGVGRSFLKKKLNSSISASYMLNYFNSVSGGAAMNLNCNLMYRISTSHQFIANARFTNNQSSSPVSVPFSELWLSAGYQFNFH